MFNRKDKDDQIGEEAGTAGQSKTAKMLSNFKESRAEKKEMKKQIKQERRELMDRYKDEKRQLKEQKKEMLALTKDGTAGGTLAPQETVEYSAKDLKRMEKLQRKEIRMQYLEQRKQLFQSRKADRYTYKARINEVKADIMMMRAQRGKTASTTPKKPLTEEEQKVKMQKKILAL